jgi:hypothetical protein
MAVFSGKGNRIDQMSDVKDNCGDYSLHPNSNEKVTALAKG